MHTKMIKLINLIGNYCINYGINIIDNYNSRYIILCILLLTTHTSSLD